MLLASETIGHLDKKSMKLKSSVPVSAMNPKGILARALTYIWTWTNIDEFWQKYGPENNITDWIKLFRFSAFIENLGVR